LSGLFIQVLRLCREAGLVKLGHVALDGTKIKANASRHKAMSYGRMKEEEARLTKEIDALLQQAEGVDAEEDRKLGRKLCARRKTIVEPVFGQIKRGRGFVQFLLRGLDKRRGEWSLVCLTHNLLKLFGVRLAVAG
jgi:hypothetical protein